MINGKYGIQHPTMKEDIRKEYQMCIKQKPQIEFNTSNRIKTIDTLAFPIFQCCSNSTQSNLADHQSLDRKKEYMRHLEAVVDSQKLPVSNGEREMMRVELCHRSSNTARKHELI